MHFKTLKPGDLVGVVAPAGPAAPEQITALPALYARHGLRVRVYAGCHANTGYLAGDDAVRLADLHAALRDDDVATIHCMRGGYGAMRLLDRIDAALLRAHPKLLIGYSDITALHALWWHAGLPSLHAPMPVSDLIKTGREDDEAALFALLKNGLCAGDCLTPELSASRPCQPGVAEGVLIGGNLSLVAALLGTPWAWPARGGILFLEDINEEPYRVDRLLTQLRLAGVLDAVHGFVLGSFTEEGSPQALLHEMLASLGKPVLSGWPTGHGTPNRPLPMGLRVRLNVQPGGPGSSIEALDDFLR
jgi:muramoyltetrapeptide carboxypeptidase